MPRTRRTLLGQTAAAVGLAALGPMMGHLRADERSEWGAGPGALPGLPHFKPKAKRVIILWMGGGMSHLDLYDRKPGLEKMRFKNLPDSVRSGVRLSTQTSGYKEFPILPAIKPFKQYGECGRWMSELLPHIGSMSDELCVINSMHTEAVNHAPGVTLSLTGGQIPGRPSLGAWLSYALGKKATNLPDYVVMTSTDEARTCGQLFYEHYWSSGFIPSRYQGVRFRGIGDPVLYLPDPDGMSRAAKRDLLDDIVALNGHRFAKTGDPEIDTRNAQYDMSYQMQDSVPDLLDIESESQHVLDLYGPDVKKRGSYAFNCLLARRLAERGSRCIQLMHSGWDQHNNWSYHLETMCRDTDQPTGGLLKDLKQRGMLDDTLVLMATEFGRTVFLQGKRENPKGYGRDHFGRCYTMWMAGAGVNRGYTHGETDDFGYHIVRDPVHVHDWQATVMHLLGIDHERLTYRYQGRQFRWTDVHGHVVKQCLA